MPKTLPELFIDQFKLCGVTPEETIAVISEVGTKQAYVDAAVHAARALNAGVLVLTASSLSGPDLPPVEADGREIPALLAAAAECDFIVDVTAEGLIHSDVRTRITGNGKRMLFVAEPENVLDRLMATEELRATVEAAGEKLRAGKTMRVTSAAGTDISVDISADDLPITMQWGYVDAEHRWDHWPSGFLACFPRDRSGQGQIVLQPGDALIPWQRYCRDYTTFIVEDGFITDIKGDGVDALVLREYMESWNDPDVYALSHMGWGVHPVANWSAFEVYSPRRLYGQELRSRAGNFMWSTGPNRFVGRETPAHLDIPMLGCSVEIDGVKVTDDGNLVEG